MKKFGAHNLDCEVLGLRTESSGPRAEGGGRGELGPGDLAGQGEAPGSLGVLLWCGWGHKDCEAQDWEGPRGHLPPP